MASWTIFYKGNKLKRNGKNNFFAASLYKYFFRTWTQTWMIVQKNGFNKKKVFQDILEYFLHFVLYFFLREGGSTCPLKDAPPLI